MFPTIASDKLGVIVRDSHFREDIDGITRGRICREIRHALRERRPVYLISQRAGRNTDPPQSVPTQREGTAH